MKRIRSTILFILILSFFILTSTSCSQSTIDGQNSDIYYVIPSMSAELPAGKTFDGIDAKISSIVLNLESSTIDLTVTNNTDVPVSCDPWHVIEIFENGDWIPCSKAHNDFNTFEKGVIPGDTKTVEYPVGQYNDITTPGNYRFKTYLYKDAAGEREKITVTFEFEVIEADAGISIKEYSYEGTEVVFSLVWNNRSDSTVYVGESYKIQKMSSDGWVDCSRTDTDFYESIHAAMSKESFEKSYHINEHYNLDTYGNYRMILEYHSGSGENTSTSCIAIEFTVPFIIE